MVKRRNRLFENRSKEDEVEGSEKDYQAANPLGQYGILPYVLKVVEITNTPFNEVLEWSINQVFYLTCYAIDKMKMDELMVKQWKRTH